MTTTVANLWPLVTVNYLMNAAVSNNLMMGHGNYLMKRMAIKGSINSVMSGGSHFCHWAQSLSIQAPVWHQAIIWTNADLLSIKPLGTNLNEIWLKTQQFSLAKMHLKMSSAKCQPFYPSLTVLGPAIYMPQRQQRTWGDIDYYCPVRRYHLHSKRYTICLEFTGALWCIPCLVMHTIEEQNCTMSRMVSHIANNSTVCSTACYS